MNADDALVVFAALLASDPGRDVKEAAALAIGAVKELHEAQTAARRKAKQKKSPEVLSVRATNVLLRAFHGRHPTKAEVAALGEVGLLSMKYFGLTTLQEVRLWLQHSGIELRNESAHVLPPPTTAAEIDNASGWRR